MDRLYCTVAQVEHDLKNKNWNQEILDYIRQASEYIDRKVGNFIPIYEARTFKGNGMDSLIVDPLLSVTSLTDNGSSIASTEYNPCPRNKFWQYGPYNRLEYIDDVWTKDEDIVITGNWGLFNFSKAISGLSNITQATSSETTLVVSNGSLVSPGMVLLIESEEELVTGFGATSAATSKLNGAISAGDDAITVDNGAEFYAGELLRIGNEDILIRKINGHVLITSRGWNGTAQASHADDLAIAVYRTFTVDRGVNGTTAATHTSKAVSQYLPPDDVNWLVRQIAGLMKMKADSGFAGKTGNIELGEVFYNNEFPKDPINEIRRNYRIVQL